MPGEKMGAICRLVDETDSSKEIVINVEHRYSEDLDVPVTTNWELTVTFTDGDASVDVVTGQLSTSYENSFCTP